MTAIASGTAPIDTSIAPAEVPLKGRDPRVDVFRGIALVMIFVDHVLGNFYSQYTLQAWGFSDAAEGFVLLAGISAGLAYSLYFRTPMRPWTGFGKVWKRVWTIYLVHLLITVAGMGATAAVAIWFSDYDLLGMNQIWVMQEAPEIFMAGLPVLYMQLDYGDILTVYLVLIFFSPIALILASRQPWLLLAGSVLLWWGTVRFHWNLPIFTRDYGWYFNPFAWQLVFVIGILTGTALKDGRRFVPVRRWLQVLTGAVLLFGIAYKCWPDVTQYVDRLMRAASRAGWPGYVVDTDKTFLALPRLLHALALAYFLSSFDFVRRACTTRWVAPFDLLGRQALPVFALGSIMIYAIHPLREHIGVVLWQDTLLIGGGVILMLSLAAARQYWPQD